MRANIGCGMTPTEGWRNFDNSWTLRMAKWPLVGSLLRRLMNPNRRAFMELVRKYKLEYGEAARIPLPDHSAEVLYSSHMIEHLDRRSARKFLAEAMRVLEPGGILRLAVPDLAHHINVYLKDQDADMLVGNLRLVDSGSGFIHRLGLFIVGPRNHQWMYDGPSLVRLFSEAGFVSPQVMPVGTTTIPDPGSLSLTERERESVYVEARSPSAVQQ